MQTEYINLRLVGSNVPTGFFILNGKTQIKVMSSGVYPTTSLGGISEQL